MPASVSLLLLTVHSTRMSIGDRAFPVATARTWKCLPQHVTSTPSTIVFPRMP